MSLRDELRENGDISVAIIGAGIMGMGLMEQLTRLEGYRPVLLAARHREKLEKNYASVVGNSYLFTNGKDEARDAMVKGLPVLTTNNELAWTLNQVDVVVDCTGDTREGARINEESILAKKDVVSLNVEVDVLLGPYFRRLAHEYGVTYTGSAGDEPGAIVELYEFATMLGLPVIAAGKGKNNPMDRTATPEALAPEAKKRGLSPRMLTSFVDATNTMIELNAVANATGLVPNFNGPKGIISSRETLTEDLRLKEEGGPLEKKGVLDFVHGIAPGVFVLVESPSENVTRELNYLSMGDGPYYALYRPYHLTNLETPLSIAKAHLRGEETIAPFKGYVAHTVAVAKRDIKEGEVLEGIGSGDFYGELVTVSTMEEHGYAPIGLITGGQRASRDIKKGQWITTEDIQWLDERLFKLFRRSYPQIFHNCHMLTSML
ncbi:MAG: SAF domain-containing protein [Tissierellia bacterium]|nr:SAF domain-containing protein [Tissierellia bacterium]